MRKTLLTLNRVVLIVGVLVALTPCGVCQRSMGKASQVCSMTPMAGKMDCCHKSKSPSPYCQVMDQTSVSVSPVHIDSAAVQAASIEIPAFQVAQAGFVASVVPSSSSPTQGFLALRI